MDESEPSPVLRFWQERAVEDERRRLTLMEHASAERRAAISERERWREFRLHTAWRRALDIDWTVGDPSRNDMLRSLYQVLPNGEPAVIETCGRFLEADPWFPGSGSRKGSIIRRLTQLDLDEPVCERLRHVLLRDIENPIGAGVRHLCRLARYLDAPALRVALLQRLTHGDPDVQRRAAWVLLSMDARSA